MLLRGRFQSEWWWRYAALDFSQDGRIRSVLQTNPGKGCHDRGGLWSPTGHSFLWENFPAGGNDGNFLLKLEENPTWWLTSHTFFLSLVPRHILHLPVQCPKGCWLSLSPWAFYSFCFLSVGSSPPTLHPDNSSSAFVSGLSRQVSHDAVPDHTLPHSPSVGWISLLWAPVRSTSTEAPLPRLPILTAHLIGCIPC